MDGPLCRYEVRRTVALMARLSRSDLEAVLDFAGEVAVAARAPVREDERLLTRIARLLGTDMLKYARVDASQRVHDVTLLGAQDPERLPTDELLEILRTEEDPYATYAARTRQPHFPATRLFDIVDRKAFQRTKLYELIPFADAPSAMIRMPGHAGCRWQLEALQPDREFTDRQLAVLDAVRPWLELYEDRRELARQIAAVRSAPVDQRRASRLTVRENQVLDRVADGASNQDVADALRISPETVRKHLENIYAKLEVTSRTAALARTGRTTVTDGGSWAER
jgi:DNA-binding CsgD family transcriptional regulator